MHFLPNIEFRSCFIFVINTEHMAEPLQLSEFEHSFFMFKSQKTVENSFSNSMLLLIGSMQQFINVFL